MVRMYNWTIKRSGTGMVVIGLMVDSGTGERKSTHKLQCATIEVFAGEIVACNKAGLEIARLMREKAMSSEV